jgi:hypothetical protein
MDWVDWLCSGGLLLHSRCGKRSVSVKESYSNSWGLPSFHCSHCRLDVGWGEVPEFHLGQKFPQLLDDEAAELGELM